VCNKNFRVMGLSEQRYECLLIGMLSLLKGNMCRIVKVSGFHDESLLMWVKFQDDACETLLHMASNYILVAQDLC
jgi:hypothetical protein